MRTKDNKMIRSRKCFLTPSLRTLQLVIFLHDALGCSESWKEFPQLCDKMETAGFCMIDWVMEIRPSGYQWSKATLKRKPIF
jgi:hypothetical protein